jgi:hypothetical protein
MGLLIKAAEDRYRVVIAVAYSQAFGSPRRSVSPGRTSTERRGISESAISSTARASEYPLKTAAGRGDVVVMDALAAMLRRHRLASRHSKASDPAFTEGNSRYYDGTGESQQRNARVVPLDCDPRWADDRSKDRQVFLGHILAWL